MKTTQIYTTKLDSCSTLIVEIEQTFNDNFSVIAYDDFWGIWIEKFADTFEQAKDKAKKLHSKLVKEYK